MVQGNAWSVETRHLGRSKRHMEETPIRPKGFLMAGLVYMQNSQDTFKTACDDFIHKYSNDQQRFRGWGLVLDDENRPPPAHVGIDFEEMEHSDIRRFFRATNEEKFLTAYWAQKQNSKKAGRYGFILGAGFVALLFIVLMQFWQK